MADSQPSSDWPASDESAEMGRHLDRIETDQEAAHYDLLEVIAQLEECEPDELPPLYERVDDLLEQLFGPTPEQKAQAQVEFTYYDYRVTIDQAGNVMLRKQLEQLEVD